MRKSKSKSLASRRERRNQELNEIELLKQWILHGQPDPGSNPLSLPPLPKNSRVGRLDENTFSQYAGCDLFSQLPISKKTKDGLKQDGKIVMTDIQRASLPHSLCGRDILGASKTGSGKTLAFVIPVLEKLYRERWGPEDGVGSIIISPTRELASELFGVLNSVGKCHDFSAGFLIGGHKGVDDEKERVNELNILVCTPGRLLQHMNETPNFDCSQLQALVGVRFTGPCLRFLAREQILVLDEADRILDDGFKRELDAIISQLPKHRQTLLFSATQTKKVQDLARLSLKGPEYLAVHEEDTVATPINLKQMYAIVPLDEKLDMLWSFIRTHLNSRILVFLTTRNQVKFTFEAFKKLRPGIPLMCLRGKMNQQKRLGTYAQYCESRRAVLFTTDVGARGLDFQKAVEWVIQVDCPSDVTTYLHRAGRTARYKSGGKCVLFLETSECKMVERLADKKIPINKFKADKKRLQPVSSLLAALLVKYPDLQQRAQRAFITYLKSIRQQKDREVFDVTKLPIDEFSASLGLPMTPKIRFLNRKAGGKKASNVANNVELDNSTFEDFDKASMDMCGKAEDEADENLLVENTSKNEKLIIDDTVVLPPATRVLKKKKLKINVHRPAGTRMVFDDEGNVLPPLATIAERTRSDDPVHVDADKVQGRFAKMREMLKGEDKLDKLQARQLRKEKRMKEKMKRKLGREEDDGEASVSDDEEAGGRQKKKSKIYFDSDDDVEKGDKNKVDINTDAVSVAEQEALALKLLSSMHS